MALSQKALQRKRAKKGENRKQRQQQGAGGEAARLLRLWSAACRAPVVEALVSEQILSNGMGTVWLSRQLPDGRYALASYLLDTYCLGVKDAFHRILEPNEYARMQAQIAVSPDAPFTSSDPSYARKLVEGAKAYASALGFDPHPDYKLAQMLFGDIDANACTTEFEFGHNGKPLYIVGPHDSPAMQQRIVALLEQRESTVASSAQALRLAHIALATEPD